MSISSQSYSSGPGIQVTTAVGNRYHRNYLQIRVPGQNAENLLLPSKDSDEKYDELITYQYSGIPLPFVSMW